jgi:thioredoxin-like negative regulator of GroEL
VDQWKLAQHVEGHPEDFPQRWKLAKQFYLSQEYRHALEHLLVLKNDWSPKCNVVRYLAATYYRLTRYSEAVSELRDCLLDWPDELEVRVQLAHALKAKGDYIAAAVVWEKIAELSSNYPHARRVARQLRQAGGERIEARGAPQKTDSDPSLALGSVCSSCGAQNSDEFERCWQCHAPLLEPHDPSVAPPGMRAAGRKKSNAAGMVKILIVLLVLATAAAGIYWWRFR